MPITVDENSNWSSGRPNTIGPVLAGLALAANLVTATAIQAQFTAQAGNEDAPAMPPASGGAEGLSYGPSPYASVLGSNVRYAFTGNEDVPTFPPGSGGDEGLSYGPMPGISALRSNVRYAITGDEIAFPATPGLPTDDDDFSPARSAYQQSLEPESVTIPLPFSWNGEDDFALPFPTPPEEYDGLVRPLAWAQPTVPQPWDWQTDDIQRVQALDDDGQLTSTRTWPAPTVAQPWGWDDVVTAITSPPIQPDDDGRLVRPLRWASPVYPQPWSFDDLAPGGIVPPTPELPGPSIVDLTAPVSGVDLAASGSGVAIQTPETAIVDVTYQPSGVDILS